MMTVMVLVTVEITGMLVFPVLVICVDLAMLVSMVSIAGCLKTKTLPQGQL